MISIIIIIKLFFIFYIYLNRLRLFNDLKLDIFCQIKFGIGYEPLTKCLTYFHFLAPWVDILKKKYSKHNSCINFFYIKEGLIHDYVVWMEISLDLLNNVLCSIIVDRKNMVGRGDSTKNHRQRLVIDKTDGYFAPITWWTKKVKE